MTLPETQIALGIVMDGNSVLIIERSQREIGRNGKPIVFAFPGGKLEKGETAMKAAERELEEETGYDVVATEVITAESHQQYPVYVHYVGCQLVGKTADHQPPDTIVGVKWVAAESISRLFSSPINERVREYIESNR